MKHEEAEDAASFEDVPNENSVQYPGLTKRKEEFINKTRKS